MWPFTERHQHRWKAVSVYHYIDVSWGDEADSTNAIYVCTGCGETRKQSFYGGGHFTVEQLNSALEGERSED